MRYPGLQRKIQTWNRDVRRGMAEGADRALRQFAQAKLAQMHRLTDQGRDYRGRYFAGYKPSTARHKGRRRPVTLFESGKTRRSWRVVKRGQRYLIEPTGQRNKRIQELHQRGTRYMASREVFGVSDADRRRLAQQTQRSVKARLRNSDLNISIRFI